ncbi:MAG: restriction endonuclease subunit S [Gammaproteobacteria bacterium]|nr:restriction endonuclease subunit S [Gammaproteobacteria bacterium]
MSGVQPYPEYKESGVEWLGEIPAHWGLHALKRSVTGCVNGIWGEEPSGQDDLVVLRVADFDRTALKVSNEKLTYRYITPKESEKRLLKSGDLLIEKSGGGEKTLVGCVVLFEHEYAAVSSNFVAKMSPRCGFDSRYLTYGFSHLYDRKVNFMSIKQTTGIQNIDSDSYLSNYFCFPDTAEQQRIADYLDREIARIDNLIAEKQNFINLLKEKRQALISHIVTKGLDPNVKMKDSGVEWIGEVPEHWGSGKIKYLASISNGATPSRDNPEYWEDGSIGWLNSSKINDGVITQADQFITEKALKETSVQPVTEGDILIAITGEGQTRGRVAICMIEATINQHLAAIRINKSGVDVEYIHFWMTSQYDRIRYESSGAGSTKGAITCADIGSYPAPIPPHDEQQRIVEHLKAALRKYDAILGETGISVELLKEHRTALISAAVTGKIDVRNA